MAGLVPPLFAATSRGIESGENSPHSTVRRVRKRVWGARSPRALPQAFSLEEQNDFEQRKRRSRRGTQDAGSAAEGRSPPWMTIGAAESPPQSPAGTGAKCRRGCEPSAPGYRRDCRPSAGRSPPFTARRVLRKSANRPLSSRSYRKWMTVPMAGFSVVGTSRPPSSVPLSALSCQTSPPRSSFTPAASL